MKRALFMGLACILFVAHVYGQRVDTTTAKQGTLGVVATAHLDTQWRWTIRNTINEFIPATLNDNFKLLDLYPGYVFSFEGAFRYQLAREYYPEEFERLRGYIRDGRWRVTGSWVDAVDVNMPSFESLVRHTLYGNGYYKREFGKTSRDIFLPDCFGFGYALPSIAAHCGLRSFSTQKLSWGSAVGVPFDIGLWQGVDGSRIVAGIRPGEYVARITGDLSCDTLWMGRVREQFQKSGLRAAYMYFGTGDQGGAPESTSVAWLQRSLESNGPLQVKSIGADDLADLVAATPEAQLPLYDGELLMTRHGAGCYTSQSAMKRWNRRNELLADATERASVIGSLFRRMTYPREALQDTWIRFLWHQFHDDLTGTSIPEAYEFSWNDQILCMNRFSQMLEHAVGATVPMLDTRTKGIPVVVYNPVAVERRDVVEATVLFDSPVPAAVQVFGPDGKEVPSQIVGADGNALVVAFASSVPSVGYSVYDVRPAKKPGKVNALVSATESSLENERYRVSLNEQGQVASMFDKRLNRELLAAPVALEIFYNKPKQWPAWEIQYEDLQAGPKSVIGGQAAIRVIENGPARGAIEVVQQHGRSTFRTVVRLAAGSDRVEFVTDIDWYEKESLLKAAFRFTSPNDSVTYDIGLGTIGRGLNTEKKYEVPAHQWADMTSADGSFGVAVLNDSRYGWDHPDPQTLCLTLLHTPGIYENWAWVEDERSQDFGHHTLTYAISGHEGDWRTGNVVYEAAQLNQPLIAFQTPKHKGEQVKTFSLCNVSTSTPQVFVNAVKMAEESDEIVVRVRELHGSPIENARLSFAWPIVAARQIDGAEEPIGEAIVQDGQLVFSLTGYQPKAFAVTLGNPKQMPATARVCQAVPLPFNIDGFSADGSYTDGDFDGLGSTISGDLVPHTITHLDVPYTFGPTDIGSLNVVRCEGQMIDLPTGPFNRLHILAAAVGGPAEGTFAVDDTPVAVWVQDWAEPIGQWHNRLTAGRFLEEPELIAPAYINRQPVAWYGSHRHTPDGNDAYRFTYAFLVSLDLPKGAKQITLPNNPNIRVFAATAVADAQPRVRPAQALYDEANAALIKAQADRFAFIDSTTISLSSPIPAVEIRYTTDGTDPVGNSTLYAGPVTMRESGVLKARGFAEGRSEGYVAQVPVSRLIPKEPVEAAGTVPGLRCRYYEGEWNRLPDFSAMEPIRDEILDTIAIPPFVRPEEYGLSFVGYVRVPADGLYDFYITSDDGSKLFVCDSLVVDNDGLHGEGELAGQIALKAGLHRIEALMFNNKGGQALGVSWRGPGLDKQPLTGANLLTDPMGRKK